MEIQRFGIVVKVNDLDACRIFYRELFAPLLPVMDSTFTVVFELAPNLTFSLEKSNAPYLEHSSCAQGWKFDSADFESLRRRLAAAGCELEPEPDCRDSGLYWRGCDPEGNISLVRQLDAL